MGFGASAARVSAGNMHSMLALANHRQIHDLSLTPTRFQRNVAEPNSRRQLRPAARSGDSHCAILNQSLARCTTLFEAVAGTNKQLRCSELPPNIMPRLLVLRREQKQPSLDFEPIAQPGN